MSSDLLSSEAAPITGNNGTAAQGAESINPVNGSTAADMGVTSTWLPQEYANEPSLKDFKDIGGLAKSYMSLNSERGRSVRIPGPDAGKEDLDKFYSRITNVKGVMRSPDVNNTEAMEQHFNSLGRPSEAKGYNIDLGDKNKYLDVKTLDSFKNVAHKAGLTSSQYKKVVEFDVERSSQQSERDMHAASSAVTLLQQKWGNEYNNRIAGAKAALNTYEVQFPEGFKELGRVAKNNPAFVAMLADLGRNMSEKGFINAPHAYGGTTTEEALQQISEIRNNREHAFHKTGAPGNKEAKLKMNNLYKAAYPENR